jgi:hypothetical protein
MASLRKKPNSRYWIACFTDGDGIQRQRSTQTSDRTTAQSMAQKFEASYAMKLTEAQARKVVSDIYEGLHGEQLYHPTTKKFLNDWLAGKQVEMSAGSYKRYKNAVDKLLAFLGERAGRDIAYVHKRDIAALRDKTATELSPATANTDLKILRVAFRQAWWTACGWTTPPPPSARSTTGASPTPRPGGRSMKPNCARSCRSPRASGGAWCWAASTPASVSATWLPSPAARSISPRS